MPSGKVSIRLVFDASQAIEAIERIPLIMTKFRIQTDAGHQYEVEAANFADALYYAGRVSVQDNRKAGRVVSLWYFRTDIHLWASGDDLIGR